MSQSEYWSDFMRRRLSRRSLIKGGTLAGVGLWAGSAIGCGSSGGSAPSTSTNQEASGPQRGGVLRLNFALTAEYNGFDPYQNYSFADPVYERLVKYNPKRDKFVPSLAESWEIPDDNTYVFKMEKEVKFHNVALVSGREVTAEDAKFSMDRALSDGATFYLKPFFTSIANMPLAPVPSCSTAGTLPFQLGAQLEQVERPGAGQDARSAAGDAGLQEAAADRLRYPAPDGRYGGEHSNL